MNTHKQNWFKFIVGFIVCLVFRLLPIRPPNIEPILTTVMPFSRAYGAWTGFIFAVLSIFTYDLLTQTLGVWTFIIAGAYGVLGYGAYFYFKKFPANIWGYASYAVIGTLFFDAVTGLTIGPLFFRQSFSSAFTGQIPFTLWHLLGNISFSMILSPRIYNLIIKNEKYYEKQEKIHIIA